MEQSILFIILLQIVLIGLNAVFACAEIAVISVNDSKMEKMAGNGDKRAARLLKLTKQPARFLATIQIAITLSGFLGSAELEEVSKTLGIPLPWDEYETFNGLVFHTLQRIPEQGNNLELEAGGLLIREIEMEENKIKAAVVKIKH